MWWWTSTRCGLACAPALPMRAAAAVIVAPATNPRRDRRHRQPAPWLGADPVADRAEKWLAGSLIAFLQSTSGLGRLTSFHLQAELLDQDLGPLIVLVQERCELG